MPLLSKRTWRKTFDLRLDLSWPGCDWECPNPRRKFTRSLTTLSWPWDTLVVKSPAKYVSNEPRLRCPRLKTWVRVLWRKQDLEDALEDRPSRKERGSNSLRRARARCFPEACLTWGRCACLLNSAYTGLPTTTTGLPWPLWKREPHDWILSFRPYGSRVPSSLIQNSSRFLLRWSILDWDSFGLGVSCSIGITCKSSDKWPVDAKCLAISVVGFGRRMHARCWLILQRKSCEVSPTYWNPHCLQEIK